MVRTKMNWKTDKKKKKSKAIKAKRSFFDKFNKVSKPLEDQ